MFEIISEIIWTTVTMHLVQKMLNFADFPENILVKKLFQNQMFLGAAFGWSIFGWCAQSPKSEYNF